MVTQLATRDDSAILARVTTWIFTCLMPIQPSLSTAIMRKGSPYNIIIYNSRCSTSGFMDPSNPIHKSRNQRISKNILESYCKHRISKRMNALIFGPHRLGFIVLSSQFQSCFPKTDALPLNHLINTN